MNTTLPHRRPMIAATAALAALGAGLLLAAPASASAATDDLAGIEDSLVHVWTEYSGYVQYPTDDGLSWSAEITVGASCTGWFASDQGHIATAGHCIDQADGREMIINQFLADMEAEYGIDPAEFIVEALESWSVEGVDPGSDYERVVEVLQSAGATDPVIEEWTIAQVVDYQSFENGDAALLKVAGIEGSQPLAIAPATPTVGEDVTAIGFPASVQGPTDWQRLAASFKSGTVSSQQVTRGGVPVTEIDAAVSGGMSGGPTVDANGDVVGINSFKLGGETQSFNFVTDTQQLLTFLATNGVAVTTGAPEATTDATEGETVSDGTVLAGPESGTRSAATDGGVAGIAITLTVVAILVLGGGGLTAGLIITSQRRRARAAQPAAAPQVAAWPEPAHAGYAPTAQPTWAPPAAAQQAPVGQPQPVGFTAAPPLPPAPGWATPQA